MAPGPSHDRKVKHCQIKTQIELGNTPKMPIWSSSFVSFSSSVSVNGKENSQRYAKQTQRSPDGTTVKTASQKGGGPMYTETLQYNSHGRPIVDGRALRSGPREAGRIEDVSDQKS
ncbi:hypothetical protein COL922a_007383 [Colletotrichum nupharicola]|nr:hypothetical protein COL922a_007383 [Colletotrichum nupharicola]